MADRAPSSGTRVPDVTEHLDTVFDLLRSARRRYVLYCLLTMEGDTVDVEVLVAAIRRYEASGRTGSDPSPRKEVWIALQYEHLPRLEEAGVLEYDRRQGTVRFRGEPPVEEWVEHARHREFG